MMGGHEILHQISNFLFSIIRLSTPLVYASLAASITKKGGMDNMAVEGMMLAGALGGVLISAGTGSAWIGLSGAMVIGMIVGIIISYAAFIGRADLYLTNISMNLTLAGGTIFALYMFCGEKASSAGKVKSFVLPVINIPLIQDIPFLGSVLSGHNILTYLAVVAVAGVYVVIYKTRFGLRLRSIGENAQAAESVGVFVTKIRFLAFIISGALGAIGGAYLSMGYISAFTRNMTANRGYIALSANNIANGSPVGAMLASIMFGAADATANALQMTSFPVDFILMIPYFVTIIGLVIVSIARNKRIKAIAIQDLATSKK